MKELRKNKEAFWGRETNMMDSGLKEKLINIESDHKEIFETISDYLYYLLLEMSWTTYGDI